MEDRRQIPDMDRLEQQVDELERITNSLSEVPDEEVVEALNRTVGLLREINAGIEASLNSVREDSGEVEALLDGVRFGPFDEALDELEERERRADESGG